MTIRQFEKINMVCVSNTATSSTFTSRDGRFGYRTSITSPTVYRIFNKLYTDKQQFTKALRKI